MTAGTLMTLPCKHGLSVWSMTALTRFLIVGPLQSMGPEIVYLLEVGLPAIQGMASITAASLTTIVNIRMAAITILR